jgi:hypothetical protein
MSDLIKIIDKLRTLAPEGEAVIAVLEVAQSVTGLGGTAAAEGLRLIDAALKSLETGSHDPVTHAQIMQRVADLHDATSADRAREDAELAALNPAPPTPEPAA